MGCDTNRWVCAHCSAPGQIEIGHVSCGRWSDVMTEDSVSWKSKHINLVYCETTKQIQRADSLVRFIRRAVGGIIIFEQRILASLCHIIYTGDLSDHMQQLA